MTYRPAPVKGLINIILMKKHLLFILLIVFGNPVLKAQSIYGVDVSNAFGNVNWPQVKNTGRAFAYTRATEGVNYTDPTFITNMANGNSAGMVMGAYHFAQPDNSGAVAQADSFLSVARNYIGTGYLPPVLDLEVGMSSFTSDSLSNWVQTWMSTVQNATGVSPVLYAGQTYINYLDSTLNVYGLWIALWNNNPFVPPSALGHWHTWVLRQYADTGTVSGIPTPGQADVDVFNGDTTAFNSLISQPATAIQPVAAATAFNVFPNPAHKQISITANEAPDANMEVDVFDIYGQLLYHHTCTGSALAKKLDIAIDTWQPGTYLLLITANGNKQVKRFLKI